MNVKETVTLGLTEGKSDKFYTISILDNGQGLFSVPFTFGRKGTAGQTGSKAENVDYDTAKRWYDRTVVEKEKKGYTKA